MRRPQRQLRGAIVGYQQQQQPAISWRVPNERTAKTREKISEAAKTAGTAVVFIWSGIGTGPLLRMVAGASSSLSLSASV
jgi:hypothetical protein